MKNLFNKTQTAAKAFFLGLLMLPTLAFALPISWDYADSVIKPLSFFSTTEVVVNNITATSTTATSTMPNLAVTQRFSFDSVIGNAWSDFCTSITGSAGLCDGSDDGGAILNWFTNSNGNLSPTTTIGVEVDHLVASSTTASSTFAGDIDLTGRLIISGDAIGDFAGTGLSVTGNTLNAEVQTSDLHDAVTLGGALDYITLSGQVLTRNTVDVSDDTNLAVTHPVILTDDTISLAFGTTTTNIWSNLQTFTSGFISNAASTINAAFTVIGDIFTGTKNLTDYADFRNGTFIETFDALVTSDGTNASTTVEQAGGGDLTVSFSSGDSTVDCTPICEVVITPGSSTTPQKNYVYILESAPTTLAVATSEWPTVEHTKITFLFCQDVAGIQSEGGCLINQNWNNFTMNGENIGGWARSGEQRRYGLGYWSGLDPAGTDQAAASSYFDYVSDTESYYKATPGVMYQANRHSMSAIDTSSTTDDIHVVNSSVQAYRQISDFTDITLDSTGASLGNSYWNICIFEVGNKTGQHNPVMATIPSGSYSSQVNAENDNLSYDECDLPREFVHDSGVGVPVVRMTLRYTGGTSALTHISSRNLREGTGISGGSGGGVTTFLGLTDSPSTYASQANKLVAVNAGETALEFITAGAGDVSAAANLTDNTLIRGDGGAKGIQDSGITISDNDAMAITIADTANEAGLTINQNDVTNKPSALEAVFPYGGQAMEFRTTADAAFLGGPFLFFDYDTTEDKFNLGGLYFGAPSSAAVKRIPATLLAAMSDDTNTAEDGAFYLKTLLTGSNATRLTVGEGVNGIKVGSGATAIVQSNGNQDLTLQTGNTTTGNITITDGANGDISLNPNGGGNVTVDGNIEFDVSGQGIHDQYGKNLLLFSHTLNAVNNFTVKNNTTGNAPTMLAEGTDTNIDLTLTPKGTGGVGIATTSPVARLDVWGASGGKIVTFFSDTGTKFMEMLNTGATTLLGTWDFSGATVKTHSYPSITWPSVSATTTTATSSILIGTAFTDQAWNTMECYTTSGTASVSISDGTNVMDSRLASTTVGRWALSTNNTFTSSEKRQMDVGILTAAQIVCSFDITVNN